MVEFQVDDVAPATAKAPTEPLVDRFPDALALGGDPALPLLPLDGVHPLLSAVGRAFADHRPLVLSPDAVWLTIMQGLAHHVRLHAEELRPRLVTHTGRKRLTVVADGPMPQDADSWQDAVEAFGKLLLDEIVHDADFECDFSTSTQVERMAGRIVLLDAYSPYFAFWMRFVCGIPSITLTGTAEDWRKIRARIEAVAAFGLEKWCRSLRPIADQFVRAAEGDVDTAFWQRIYSPADAYGGEVVTGWAARFYPYLTGNGVTASPNPLLELPIGEPRDLTVDENMSYRGPGVRSDAVPAVLSRVTVNVNDRVAGENRAVALHGGLVGVAQDGNGALRPVAGWFLAPATVRIDDVIDRIVENHETDAPRPERLLTAPADLVALYRRVGSARLFGGAWRLLPVASHRRFFRGEDKCSLVTVIDLSDGTNIGMAIDADEESIAWVRFRIARSDGGPRLGDAAADVPVYGSSLALLLDAALDSGGDVSHLETGRLDELDQNGRHAGRP